MSLAKLGAWPLSGGEITTKQRYRVYQVDAFTTQRFAGNPAGVITNAEGLSDADMRAIARELNNSETAFIFPPDARDHDVRVRFFTPTTEVPSCGHATIAAHYVRALEGKLPTSTVIQRIGAGILPINLLRDGSDYRVIMTQGRPAFSPPFDTEQRNDTLNALGLTGSDMDERCPMRVVSPGHSKVLIGLRSVATLNRVSPNLIALADLSAEIGCNGYYLLVVSNGTPMVAHARMFAPAIGIAEDPVTGNGAGPLGAYLVAHGMTTSSEKTFRFTIRQGEAMGRAGQVDVSVDVLESMPQVVRVSGRAVIVFQAEMTL